MPAPNLTPNNAVLSQFVDRFHQDRAFRSLAESDAHAALRSVGVRVPAGVSVRFAESAARAVGMMLDRPANGRAGALDDDLLAQVAGGAAPTAGNPDELRQFLGLFNLHR